MIKDIIIAIDGNSACGKSTTSRLVANYFNYRYLDSGAMYRAVSLFFLNNKILPNQVLNNLDQLNNIHIEFKSKDNSQFTYLNGKNVEREIRSDKISSLVSSYSSISVVRKLLVKNQKLIGKNKKIVVEGRDITTVVFPNADIKFFMTADIEVRARRRYEEMRVSNNKISLSEIRKNLDDRDKEDSSRKDSPLTVSDQAIIIDTSYLKIDDQVKKLLKSLRKNFLNFFLEKYIYKRFFKFIFVARITYFFIS